MGFVKPAARATPVTPSRTPRENLGFSQAEKANKRRSDTRTLNHLKAQGEGRNLSQTEDKHRLLQRSLVGPGRTTGRGAWDPENPPRPSQRRLPRCPAASRAG